MLGRVPFTTGFAAGTAYTDSSEVMRMTVVYLDRVVVLNGLVDYLLLLGTAWLCGLTLIHISEPTRPN